MTFKEAFDQSLIHLDLVLKFSISRIKSLGFAQVLHWSLYHFTVNESVSSATCVAFGSSTLPKRSRKILVQS
jgi:hypothetical protein